MRDSVARQMMTREIKSVSCPQVVLISQLSCFPVLGKILTSFRCLASAIMTLGGSPED
jgi:hypothetical protein